MSTDDETKQPVIAYDAYRRALDRAYRDGREAAAADIEALKDEYAGWPAVAAVADAAKVARTPVARGGTQEERDG